MTQPSATEAKLVDKDDNPQIADRQTSITAVTEAHALNATFSDTEVEAALDLLGVTINQIIDRLEAHGLAADN